MQSLLTTMAILIANHDEHRDYLANFEPFVLDRLCAWPVDEPVRHKALSKALSDAFSLPPIPINTVTQLCDRAKKDDFLRRRHDNKDYPNRKKLEGVRDVLGQRTETLSHLNALNAALRAYALERFELTWSDKQADEILESFVTEFGIELATARREGEIAAAPRADIRTGITVVHSFARSCLDTDPQNFRYLEEMVKGSMLTNVLYFNDLGSWTPKMENLTVYLDTPLALRLLGLAPEELALGAEQLMELLRAFRIPVRVFQHTVHEMLGVLGGVRGNLELARQQQLEVSTMANLNREVIEHLMQAGWSPGDVQAVMVGIDKKLSEANITVEQTPDYGKKELSIDERAFEEMLLAKRFTKAQVAMDIKSISAIHRLRAGRPAMSLGRAHAVFVTSNRGLVRESGRFFRAQGDNSPVRQCISDLSLTTQLWLLGANQSKSVPRKILIAESFAALNPPPATWRRYLEKIEIKRKAGEVTDEEVKTLVFSSVAHEGLLEVTQGDPARVTEDTPAAVLERYKQMISAEAAKSHAKKFEADLTALQAENERLRQSAQAREGEVERQKDQLQAQREELDALMAWQRNIDRSRIVRNRRLRAALGIGLAALTLLGGAVLVVEVASGALGIALVGFAASLAALATVGWGFGKPWEWSTKAVVWLGAFLALFAVILSVAQALPGT